LLCFQLLSISTIISTRALTSRAERTCYFDPTPWGPSWSVEDFCRARGKEEGEGGKERTWLKIGDACTDHRDPKKPGLEDFCYCTNHEFKRCVWRVMATSCDPLDPLG
jgi:hypothetical protein